MIPHVIAVEALPGYRLQLAFRSGELRTFDASSYLDRGLFLELRDENLFAQVKLALGTVEWPNGVDFDPEALYQDSLPSEIVFDGSGHSHPQVRRRPRTTPYSCAVPRRRSQLSRR